jgi:hypothetical protein
MIEAMLERVRHPRRSPGLGAGLLILLVALFVH